MAYSRYWVGLIGILMGILAGFLIGVNPLYVGLILFIPAFIIFFFKNFELTVIGLLILRSALDPFSDQGLTGAFAIGISALTLIYVIVRLLSKQTVHIDSFWCFFAGWLVVQGIWVVLLPLGGLGLGSTYLSDAAREWVRVLSWLMSYLLTLQLKERLHPEQIVNSLFLALVIPLSTAFLQLVVPGHFLPSFLAVNPNQHDFRINGTLGLANTFVTFLIFFIGLVYWKLSIAQKRLPWFLLLGILVFYLVTTKVLVGIGMLVVLIATLVIPRLNFSKTFGGILLLAIMVGLFASTDYGRERLTSITQTPLLNPDIDVSRAVLLAASDDNSFNWRIAQWTSLVGHWQHFPLLGYGLQTTNSLGPMFAWAHNDYVRALVEEGIVGLVLFLLFLGVQLVRLLQIIRSPLSDPSQKQFCSVLFAFLLAAMVGMLTENVWSHTALFLYWFSMLAIASWNWSKFPLRSDSSTALGSPHFQ
ncbi:MAG: O-antigen ligase family protein [Nostoc sp.]|uniref:O-antigen ligase family protein n=1 Tax=Nostoc sp. TaxID=1180 RepID=UPI002FF6E071